MLNLVTVGQTIWSSVGASQKIFGVLFLTPLGCGAYLATRLPHKYYHGKFGHSRSNGWCVITEILQRSLTLHILRFKVTQVIGTNTDRLATCDFLLIFHGNYGPISYHFPVKWQYLQNFLNPVYLTPSLRGIPLEFCNGGRAQKLE